MNKKEILERSYAAIDEKRVTYLNRIKTSTTMFVAGMFVAALCLAGDLHGENALVMYSLVAILVGGGAALFILSKKKDDFLSNAQETLEMLNQDEFGSITNIALGARKSETEIIEVFETLKSMNLLNSVIDKASMTIQVY